MHNSSEQQSLAQWAEQAARSGALADPSLTITIDGDSLMPASATLLATDAEEHIDSATSLTQATLATYSLPQGHAAQNVPQQALTQPSTTGLSQRYRLLRILGSGGMGDVFLAEQHELEREVAIKVVKHRADRPQRLDAFRAEVQITGLLDHPGVVPVHDAGNDFYVMKRIRGHTLEDLLRQGMSHERIAEIMLRVCETLAFAHHKGIIHRDIKPSNIMVGAYGETLLLDWGLALCVDPDRRNHGPRIPHLDDVTWLGGGTPAYAAPEMVRGDRQRLGYASDVFLLGATLYRCIAGRPPYLREGAMEALEAALRCHHPKLAEIVPDAPQRLIRLVERCLHPDSQQRGDIHDVINDLHDWQHHLGASNEARQALRDAEEYARQAAVCNDTVKAYTAWQEAIARCERARTLDPELQQASLTRHSARAAYAQRALGAGDLSLAESIVEREDADEATTPLVDVRAAIITAAARRARIRRRNKQLSVLSTVFLISTLGLLAYEGWRVAADLGTQQELLLQKLELQETSAGRIADLRVLSNALVDQLAQLPSTADSDLSWRLIGLTRDSLDRLSSAANATKVAINENEQQRALRREMLDAYQTLAERCLLEGSLPEHLAGARHCLQQAMVHAEYLGDSERYEDLQLRHAKLGPGD